MFVLVITCQAATADAPRSLTLINAELRNGSFEANAKSPLPWRITRRFKVTEPELALVTGADAASRGDQHVTLAATNELHERGSVGIGIEVRGPQLDGFREFVAEPDSRWILRLTWVAKTRKPLGFSFATGLITLRHARDSGQPDQHFRLREAVSDGDWQTFSLEGHFTSKGEFPVDSMRVNLGFDGHDGSTVTRKLGSLDNVRLSVIPAPETEETRLADAMKTARERVGLQENAVSEVAKPEAPIPVRFQLDKPGNVTLVIEDESGKRVRNLISAIPFEAGEHTVFWDGLDEGQTHYPEYRIQRQVVPTGTYRVRGLVRDELRLTYEFTVSPNVPGTPWSTDTGRHEGGWLGDHGNPTATLFLPAERAPGGRDQMLLANSVNESAHGLAWVDLDGRKLAGQKTLGGHYTGASHLAYDRGSEANPEIYAYGRMDWTDGIRLTGLGPQGDVKITLHKSHGSDGGSVGDLAVHDGTLVLSVFEPDKLAFYDVRKVTPSQSARLLGEVSLTKPHALCFDNAGRLLAVSGNRVLRYEPGTFPDPLSEPGILIADCLDEPRDLAVDPAGNIYIAEWGQSHQVQVYDSKGARVRSIGKPGGPVTGRYDPERMAFPCGLSVDSEGKLWVAARRWWAPKAIYVWNADGEHVRNHYGPPAYGGGGNFDPEDPTRFLYHDGKGGVEYRVDWETGTAQPHGIYQLPFGAKNDRWDQRAEFFVFRGSAPSLPYRARGHRYITNGFANPTNGTGIVLLLRDQSPENSPPLMMLGKVGVYEAQLKRLELWDSFGFDEIRHGGFRFNAIQKALFCWVDRNHDGQPQPDEFTFHTPDILIGDSVSANGSHFGKGAGIIRSVELGQDLEILVNYYSGQSRPGGILRLRPERVDDRGTPHYDLTKSEAVGTDESGQHDVNSHALALENGDYIQTGGPIQGYRDGQLLWTYHNQWPSLHRGHASPRSPEHPGQLLAATRVLAPPFRAKKGEAGELWAINSNYGLAYLFTGDGLFVDTLFDYASTGRRWNFPEHERGMDITDVCYIDETFFPTLTQFEDGRVVMVAGKSHSSVAEVHGLETIRRIEGQPVEVSRNDLNRIETHHREFAAWKRSRSARSNLLLIRRMPSAPRIDGDFTDWPLPAWVTVRRERVAVGFGGRDVDFTVAAAAFDETNLYLAFRSRGKNVLKSEGRDITHLFKNGGGLDLHLASRNSDKERDKAVEGDVRLLIAQTPDGIVAARYRPVVPGTESPVIYDSPVARTRMDAVDDVSDRIQVAVRPTAITEGHKPIPHEEVEVAIPLELLGWSPDKLPNTIGDIGVLVGDGGATSQRIYWHNSATGLVSDIPNEARLEPSMWGIWAVESMNR